VTAGSVDSKHGANRTGILNRKPSETCRSNYGRQKPSIDDLAVDIKDVEKKLEEMKIKDLEIGGMREFKPKSPLAIAVYLIGLAMSLFHIWVLTIRAIDPWYFRTMHVVFAGVLLFLLVPRLEAKRSQQGPYRRLILIAMLVAPAVYIFIEFDEWILPRGCRA